MKLALGILALLLNIAGYVPYIRDIFLGVVKPHRYTWGIWTILTTVACVNQIANHGGWSALFFISTAVLVPVTFLLSLKYGQGGAVLIDRICLALAILLLIYWIGGRNTHYSTYLAVTIDALGALPTLTKTYRHPGTETYPQWVLAAVAGVLTLFTVPSFALVVIIYPIYIAVMNGAVVGIKFLRER